MRRVKRATKFSSLCVLISCILCIGWVVLAQKSAQRAPTAHVNPLPLHKAQVWGHEGKRGLNNWSVARPLLSPKNPIQVEGAKSSWRKKRLPQRQAGRLGRIGKVGRQIGGNSRAQSPTCHKKDRNWIQAQGRGNAVTPTQEECSVARKTTRSYSNMDQALMALNPE